MENDTALLAGDPVRFEMIPHWVMDHPEVTPNAVRLYLQLRRYSGKSLVAFPSRRRLAEDLGITIPTVDAAKRVLVDIGAIKVESRVTERGDYTSNLYTIRWEQQVTIAEGGKETDTTVVKKSTPGSGKKLHTNLYPLETDLLNLDIDSSQSSLFDDFWQAYPRKAAKGAARKAWDRAVRKADPSVIIAGAQRYSHDLNRDPTFTAHAATWLNHERWNDEPLPARAARTGGQARMSAYEGLFQQLGTEREITA